MQIETSDIDLQTKESEGYIGRRSRIKSIYRADQVDDRSIVRHRGLRDVPPESQIFQLNQTVLSPSPSQICDILSSPNYPLGYVSKRRYFKNSYLESRNRQASIVTSMFNENELKRMEDKFWKSKKGIPWSLELEEELQTYLKLKAQEKKKRKSIFFGQNPQKPIIVNGDMRLSITKAGVKLKERNAMKQLKREQDLALANRDQEKQFKSRRKVSGTPYLSLSPSASSMPAEDSRYIEITQLRKSYHLRAGRDNYMMGRVVQKQRKALISDFEYNLFSSRHASSSNSSLNTTTDESSSVDNLSVLERASVSSSKRNSKTSSTISINSRKGTIFQSDSKASFRGSRKKDDMDRRMSSSGRRSSTSTLEKFGLRLSDSISTHRESRCDSIQSKDNRSGVSDSRQCSSLYGVDSGSGINVRSHFKIDKKISKGSSILKEGDFQVKFPKSGFQEKSRKIKYKLSVTPKDLSPSPLQTPDNRSSVAKILDVIEQPDLPVGLQDIHIDLDSTKNKWLTLSKKVLRTYKTMATAYADKPPQLYTIAHRLNHLWKKSQLQDEVDAEGKSASTGRWDDFYAQRDSAILSFIIKEREREGSLVEEEERKSDSLSVPEQNGTLLVPSDFNVLTYGSKETELESLKKTQPDDVAVTESKLMTLPPKKPISKETVHKERIPEKVARAKPRSSGHYDIMEERKKKLRSSANIRVDLSKVTDNVELYERSLSDKKRDEKKRRLSEKELDYRSESEDVILLDITDYKIEDTPVDDSRQEKYSGKKLEHMNQAYEMLLEQNEKMTKNKQNFLDKRVTDVTIDKHLTKRRKNTYSPEKAPVMDTPVEEKLDKKRQKPKYGTGEQDSPASPTDGKSGKKKKEKIVNDKHSRTDIVSRLKKGPKDKHRADNLQSLDSPIETKVTERKTKHSGEKKKLSDSPVDGILTKRVRDKLNSPTDEISMRTKKEKVSFEDVQLVDSNTPQRLAISSKEKFISEKGELVSSTFEDTEIKKHTDQDRADTVAQLDLHAGQHFVKEETDTDRVDESQLLNSESDDIQPQLQQDEYETDMKIRKFDTVKKLTKKQTYKYKEDEFKLKDSLVYDTQLQFKKYRTDTMEPPEAHTVKKLTKKQTYKHKSNESRIMDSATDVTHPQSQKYEYRTDTLQSPDAQTDKKFTKKQTHKIKTDESRILDSAVDDTQQQLQQDEYETGVTQLRDSHPVKTLTKKQTNKYRADEFRMMEKTVDDTHLQSQKDKEVTDTTQILDSHTDKKLTMKQSDAYRSDKTRILDEIIDDKLASEHDDTIKAETTEDLTTNENLLSRLKDKSDVEDERLSDVSTERNLSKRKRGKMSSDEERLSDLSTESKLLRQRMDTFIKGEESLLDASPSAILEIKQQQKLHRDEERVKKWQKESKHETSVEDLMTMKLVTREKEREKKRKRISSDQKFLEDSVIKTPDRSDSEELEILTPNIMKMLQKNVVDKKSPPRKRSEVDDQDLDEDVARDSKLDFVRSQMEYLVNLDKSKPKIKGVRRTRERAIRDLIEQEAREVVDDGALDYKSPTTQLRKRKIERDQEMVLEDGRMHRTTHGKEEQASVEDLVKNVGSTSDRKKGKSEKSKKTEGSPERITKKRELVSVHKKGGSQEKVSESPSRVGMKDEEGSTVDSVRPRKETRKEHKVAKTDSEIRFENEQQVASSRTELLDGNLDAMAVYQKTELPVPHTSSSILKLALGSRSRIDSKLFGADDSLGSWEEDLDLSSNGSSDRYSDITNPSATSDNFDNPKVQRRLLPKISLKPIRSKAPPRKMLAKEFYLPDIELRRRQFKNDHPFTGWDKDSMNVPAMNAHLPKLMDHMPMLINFTTQEENKYNIMFPDYDTLHFPLGSPRTECQHYITQFGIMELFEFMLYNLVISKPDQPLDYLLELSRGIMKQMKKHRAVSRVFTSDPDISTGLSITSSELLSHRTSPVQSAHPLY